MLSSEVMTGCTMAFWAARNMGVLFGGVSDTDPDEETLESVFYNELFVPSLLSALLIVAVSPLTHSLSD